MADVDDFFKKAVSRRRNKIEISDEELQFLRSGCGRAYSLQSFKERHYALQKSLSKEFSDLNFSLNELEKEMEVGDLKVDPLETKIRKEVARSAREIAGAFPGQHHSASVNAFLSAKAFNRKVSSFEQLDAVFDPLRHKNHDTRLHEAENRNAKNNSLTEALITQRVVTVLNSKGFTPIAPNEVVVDFCVHDWGEKRFSSRFLVLGSNSLGDLKNAIFCSNYSAKKDKFGQAFESALLSAVENRSGAFFFIENSFYEFSQNNEAGGSECRKTRKFLKADGKNYPVFNAENNSVLIENLHLKAGSIYFFQHKARCRHFVVVSDIRIKCDADPHNANCYPWPVFIRKNRFVMCDVCEDAYADYVAFGDLMAEWNKYFYCRACFEMMHCDAEGKLLPHDFRIFNCNLEN